MKINALKYLVSLIVVLFIGANKSTAFQDNTQKPEIDARYISSVNEFGFKLLKSLALQDTKKIYLFLR